MAEVKRQTGEETTVPAPAFADNGLSALDNLGLELAELRTEAIDGKKLQGIEKDWIEDDEHYIGIDNANRSEMNVQFRGMRPVSSVQQPFVVEAGATKPDTPQRSTAFLNITRPYVDAAASRTVEMEIGSDERFFDFDPTPIPDLEEIANSEIAEEMVLFNGQTLNKSELARAILDIADERAEKAEQQVLDWFEEGDLTSKIVMMEDDRARIGTGILKGPVPNKKRVVRWHYDEQQGSVRNEEFPIIPESRWVDPYNAFPDPVCGEDIQNGEYHWERDFLTKRKVRELKDQPGYIASQIDSCLREGPISAETEWRPDQAYIRPGKESKLFEIWYGYCETKPAKVIACGVELPPHLMQKERVSVLVEMINHRVVKLIPNPLDDGSFPYDYFVWQRRPGMPWGMGVSRQMRTPQRELNSANRAMMDNAAATAGPQIVIDTMAIEPLQTDDYRIHSFKVWVRKPGASLADVRQAFMVINIDTRQEQLLNIINFSLRMAEESTGLPAILQGFLGQNKTDRVAIAEMQQNNASSVLRRLAKIFDDAMARHLKRYYNWLMEYGTDDDMKGDYTITTKVSTSILEKNIHNQELAIILDMIIKDPELGDKEKAFDEYVRSRKMSPKIFKKDASEQEEIQPQPVDPKVQAAAMQIENDREQREADAIEGEKERKARMTEKLIDTNTDIELFNAESKIKKQEGSGL